MWWVRSETVDVFLGRGRLGIQGPGTPARWLKGASAAELWAEAMDEIGGARRTAVRVWLSGSLARPFVLPAIEGLSKLADAKPVAAARAPEETGLAGPCCVSTDAWRPVAKSVWVAMDEDLRRMLSTNSPADKIRVTTIRPWWSAVLCDPAADAKSLSILTVDDGESLVALAGTADQIDVASSYVPAPDLAQRMALVQRMSLGEVASTGNRRHAELQLQIETPSPAQKWPRCSFSPIWTIAP